jgi:hypothetical protein
MSMDKDREAFETMARRFGATEDQLRQDEEGCYFDRETQSHWVVFGIAWGESLDSVGVRPASAWRVIDRKGKRFTVYNEGLASAVAAEGLSVTPMCDLPPEGWECSRAPDHSGPCAASEVQP